MKQSLKIIAASALATAALIKGVPAISEPAPVNVRIVHTADLDLGSAAGRQLLDRRLVHAVAEVCGSASDADLSGQNQVRKCRLDLLAGARQRGAELTAGRGASKDLLIAAR